ncbi:MAG: hypothetical protein C0467_20370 [Planctomycetaceae bacterium]|nr:hypothetical protein [Planctomycetaceae bacterium]
MRSRWLLSLGVCVLSSGFIDAQPTRSPASTPGETRAVVPSGVQAPINKLAERNGVRGYADASDSRAILPPATATRQIGQPERGDRAYHVMTDPQVAARSLVTTAPARDVASYRQQPGDKVNKLPEGASTRHLAPQDSERSALPALLVVPIDRRGLGER